MIPFTSFSSAFFLPDTTLKDLTPTFAERLEKCDSGTSSNDGRDSGTSSNDVSLLVPRSNEAFSVDVRIRVNASSVGRLDSSNKNDSSVSSSKGVSSSNVLYCIDDILTSKDV